MPMKIQMLNLVRTKLNFRTPLNYLSCLGKLFLFGKTPLLDEDKSINKTFISICLIIDNIPKQVFLLPKPGVRRVNVKLNFRFII